MSEEQALAKLAEHYVVFDFGEYGNKPFFRIAQPLGRHGERTDRPVPIDPETLIEVKDALEVARAILTSHPWSRLVKDASFYGYEFVGGFYEFGMRLVLSDRRDSVNMHELLPLINGQTSAIIDIVSENKEEETALVRVRFGPSGRSEEMTLYTYPESDA